MTNLPKSRQSNIVVQETGNELFVYDLITNKAFCLNETSKIVFEACDGKTIFDDLKSKYRFTDALIFLTLNELKRENLLENQNFVSPFSGMSRREMVRQAGLSSIAALPLISTVIAPPATQALSGPPPAAPACTTSGNLSQSICARSNDSCTIGTNGCCSRRAVTVSQPCPIQPNFNVACQCL